MRYRVFLAAAVSLVAVLPCAFVGTTALADGPPAPAPVIVIPDHSPGMTLLEPSSPTRITAGSTVGFFGGWAHVLFEPYVDFTYRTPSGDLVVLNFDIVTFAITTPVDWTPGRYRLHSITSSAGGTGTQYRDHHFVGNDEFGTPVTGTTALDLSVGDLRIVRATHCSA